MPVGIASHAEESESGAHHMSLHLRGMHLAQLNGVAARHHRQCQAAMQPLEPDISCHAEIRRHGTLQRLAEVHFDSIPKKTGMQN